jgi:hypothetical protein
MSKMEAEKKQKLCQEALERCKQLATELTKSQSENATLKTSSTSKTIQGTTIKFFMGFLKKTTNQKETF